MVRIWVSAITLDLVGQPLHQHVAPTPTEDTGKKRKKERNNERDKKVYLPNSGIETRLRYRDASRHKMAAASCNGTRGSFFLDTRCGFNCWGHAQSVRATSVGFSSELATCMLFPRAILPSSGSHARGTIDIVSPLNVNPSSPMRRLLSALT